MKSNTPAQPITWLVVCCCLAGCEIRDVPTHFRVSQQAEPENPGPTGDWTSSSIPEGRTATNGDQSLRPHTIAYVDGYVEGYRRSERENKPMLVFFTAAWCKYCHEMERGALADGEVVDLSRRFICVRVDADAQREVCQEVHVRAYPTVQFVSPRGVPLNRLVGKKTSHEMLVEMHAALQAVARRLVVPDKPSF